MHGQRAAGLRFGDRRVDALLHTLFWLLPTGFRNRDIRAPVGQLLGRPPDHYGAGHLTYDMQVHDGGRALHCCRSNHRFDENHESRVRQDQCAPSAHGTTGAYAATMPELYSMPNSVTHPLVRSALELMRLFHNDSTLTLSSIARRLRLSCGHLSHLMRVDTGERYQAHLNKIRMFHAEELLRSSQLSVKEVGVAVGYDSTASFDHAFRRTYGKPPTAWRSAVAASERHTSSDASSKQSTNRRIGQ